MRRDDWFCSAMLNGRGTSHPSPLRFLRLGCVGRAGEAAPRATSSSRPPARLAQRTAPIVSCPCHCRWTPRATTQAQLPSTRVPRCSPRPARSPARRAGGAAARQHTDTGGRPAAPTRGRAPPWGHCSRSALIPAARPSPRCPRGCRGRGCTWEPGAGQRRGMWRWGARAVAPLDGDCSLRTALRWGLISPG